MAAILSLLLAASGAVAFALSRGEDAPDAPPPAAEGVSASGRSTGLLVEVRQEQLTLMPEGGGSYEVYALRPIDRGRIDLFHLLEHVREKLPVHVVWEQVGDTRYATSVEDA